MRTAAVRAGRRMAVVVAVGLITGCAGERYVRETTQITAGHVDSLQRDYARYLQGVEGDAAGRIEVLAQERQRLARAEQSLQQKMAEWKDGKPALHEALMTEAAERIKADRAIAQRAEAERTALAQAQKKLERDALDRLKDLSKQLSELARPAPFKDQVGFLVEYFQAVGKATSDLDAKAREAKKNAEKTQPGSSQ